MMLFDTGVSGRGGKQLEGSHWSERAVDFACLAFALWTVCAHLVVFTGKSLATLVTLYGLAASTILASMWLLMKEGGAKATTIGPTEEGTRSLPPLSPRPLGSLRVAGFFTGVGLVFIYWWSSQTMLFWWASAAWTSIMAVLVLMWDEPRLQTTPKSLGSELLLWGMAVICTVITLMCHRPDADDAFYVNLAVAAADQPGWALLSSDTMHGIPGMPLHLPVYRVHSYELLNGALSWLSSIPAIYCFHWISASVAALLVPLAHARLFRILTPRFWAWSVGVMICVLLACGETHRAYGNFSFVRMWQGKAIFLSFFMPLVYAYGLRFVQAPSKRAWVLLAAAQIGAVGCSSSALWAAPVGAFTALLAGSLWLGRRRRGSTKLLILGLLASAYIVVLGLSLKSSTSQVVWREGPLLEATEALSLESWIEDAWITVLGDKSPLFWTSLLALLISWTLAPGTLGRSFALTCALVALLFLFNPFVVPWIRSSVTPAYWRISWGLPLPILLTLILTSPLHIGRAFQGSGLVTRRYFSRGLLVGTMTFAFAIGAPAYTTLSASNRVEIEPPRLKVPPVAYHWAKALNESVLPGAHVIAPREIAPWITTFRHHAHPLVVRHYLTQHKSFLEKYGTLEYRQKMMDSTVGDGLLRSAGSVAKFVQGLDEFSIRGVCLRANPRIELAREALQQKNFERKLSDEHYELWIR